MRLEVRHQLWIAAVAVAVFFVNLGATRFWDQDEAFFARTAVEMQQRHDWVVPYFNDELFAHKPPLMYWMMRSRLRTVRYHRVCRAVLVGGIRRRHGTLGLSTGPANVQCRGRPLGRAGDGDFADVRCRRAGGHTG